LAEGKEFIGDDIDEDISIKGLIAGRQSGESQEPFKKWLAKCSDKAS
jgi:hypothetical protein